jgi:iron complex outermembrane receptor protein
MADRAIGAFMARRSRALAGAAIPACILAVAGSATASNPDAADELETVIVTAPRMSAPLLVVTDPKQPHQPLPAHDGADYLKSIPGFSVIRKGGTDGDPVFRGMAASRVNMLVDGQQVLGGCGMRMDPPTAYVFPQAYDRIVVIKGPQTVLLGPGNSAATVSFERTVARFEEPGATGSGSALGGSFGRTDLVGDLRLGTPGVYGQVTGTRAESDDYVDGDGEDVHSRYMRWSGNAALGWTPGEHTRVELSGALSDGEAAYADRTMDGVKFDRENVGLRLDRELQGDHVKGIEAQAYYNYVDHVMDNYSLRTFTPTASMPNRSVSNPDRHTTGGKVTADLAFGQRVEATVGVDRQENRHTLRSSMNQAMLPYEDMARVEDGRFRNAGVFGEFTVLAGASGRVIAGLRVDDWYAEDSRETLSVGMSRVPNPTAGEERNETLVGGFGRYERDLSVAPLTLYAGLGHVERFPDYWELISAGKESADSLSAFHTRPEKTTQFDTGLVYAATRLSFSASAFYSDVQDYILIQSNYLKGARRTTISRNVDATTWGGEADALYALLPSLRLSGTLAYTQGRNATDDAPLAQMPPLEARIGLDYLRGAWSAGALVRSVAEQDRYVINQGNIVGQDLGPTQGFTVFSINGGWRPRAGMLLTAGIDNLFDRTYAEHLSRGGAMVSGYEQTTKVNEPGRTLWMKFDLAF